MSIHTFDYILTNNQENINLSFASINTLGDLLGIRPETHCIKNFDSIMTLLSKDYIYFKVIKDLENLLLSHSSYDGVSTLDSDYVLYDINGNQVYLEDLKFAQVTNVSAYDYITTGGKLLILGDNISQNINLSSDFVSNTLEHITNRLSSIRNTLYGSPSGGFDFSLFTSGGLLPLYNIWMSKTVQTTVTPQYITPLTEYDTRFITFMVLMFDKGIDFFKNDIPTMNNLDVLGISSDIITLCYVLSYGGNVNDTLDIKNLLSLDYVYKTFVNNAQTIINYLIPLIVDIKDRVIKLGLPNYYIYYGLFLIAMKNKRTNIINIAKINISNINYPFEQNIRFYPNGDIFNPNNSILFSGYSGI